MYPLNEAPMQIFALVAHLFNCPHGISSMHVTVRVSDYLLTCLSVWLDACLSGWLAGWMPVWLDACLAGWLDACLFACLLACPSVRLSILMPLILFLFLNGNFFFFSVQ
eukprot:scpid107026/ scgid2756/ 